MGLIDLIQKKENRIFFAALVCISIIALDLHLFFRGKDGGMIDGSVLAATSPWTQTDWSGGQSDSLATGNVTTYKALSDVDPTTSPGQFNLPQTAGWSTNYANWAYRKKITFDNTDATLGVTTENLTNFPVLVKLDSGSDIDYTKTQDAGEDIRFEDTDGTALSYEIETWDESGSSCVWVKVPQINANSNTDYIYMYYGNSGASDGQNVYDVWSNGYVLVYHLKEESGSGAYILNSAQGLYPGTPNGTSADSSSQIGTGRTFANATDNIELNSAVNLFKSWSQFTYQAWIYLDYADDATWDSAGNEYIFYHGTSFGNGVTKRNGVETGYVQFAATFVTAGAKYKTMNGLTRQNWTNVVYTYDNDTYRGYLNANEGFNETIGSDVTGTHGYGMLLGDSADSFNGGMDEVRFSNVGRSEAWVAADYQSQTDSINTFALEEVKLSASTGNLTSNILDAGTDMNWGVLSFTTSGSGTVTVKARSDSNSDMSGATAWGSCDAITSGVDISSNNCITDSHRYIQYYVALTADGSITPVFEEVSIAFVPADQTNPTQMTNVGLNAIADKAWTNTEPTITWTEGADTGGSGLLGYCIALDEADPGASHSSDPELTAGLLGSIDDGIVNNACPFIIAMGESFNLSGVSGLTLTTGKQYYISMKAVDNAGNIWAGASGDYQDLVSFQYDDTPPTLPGYISLPSNFVSTEEVNMVWPSSGGSAPGDVGSGLAGLQYKINAGAWYGDLHTGAEDNTDVLTNDGLYTTDATFDYPLLNEGVNEVYLRVLDDAGNISTTYLTGYIKINTSSPSEVRNLSVTPSSNTNNAYAFDWDTPTTYQGLEANITYCYTVNTLPSVSTCSYTSAGITGLSSDAYATQPGTNTMYIVAKDEADNINYDAHASIGFSYTGTAPGIPINVDVADISVKSTNNWKLVVSWEEPSNVGAGISYYEVYRSNQAGSCSSNLGLFSKIGTINGTSFVNSNLSQVRYYYCVKACDSANNCSAVSATSDEYPTGRYTVPANMITTPAVSNITTKRATITWATDRISDSKIAFGTSSNSYFSGEVYVSDQTTNHTVILNNLEPGTIYYFKAKWTDEDGNTGESVELSFVTDPPPILSDVQISSTTLSSALVNFTSRGAVKARVYYGETKSFGGVKEISVSEFETNYTILLEDLRDGTLYYYSVNLVDREGREYDSVVFSFETPPSPEVSNIRVQEVKNTALPTVLVTWESNTEVSSILSYYPGDLEVEKRDSVDTDFIAGEHKMLLKGLEADSIYTLIIKGIDKNGNEVNSPVHSFSTATDSRPPVISNIKSEGMVNIDKTGAEIIISWKTDEIATSQVEYAEGTGTVYTTRSQEDLDLTNEHIIVIPDLELSKVYHFRVISSDSTGNKVVSIDNITITPKASESALDLVLESLADIFGFL